MQGRAGKNTMESGDLRRNIMQKFQFTRVSMYWLSVLFCLLSSPVTGQEPYDGYANRVRDLCGRGIPVQVVFVNQKSKIHRSSDNGQIFEFEDDWFVFGLGDLLQDWAGREFAQFGKEICPLWTSKWCPMIQRQSWWLGWMQMMLWYQWQVVQGLEYEDWDTVKDRDTAMIVTKSDDSDSGNAAAHSYIVEKKWKSNQRLPKAPSTCTA